MLETSWRERNTYSAAVEISLEISQKVKTELAYHLTVPLLTIYPENSTPLHRGICTPRLRLRFSLWQRRRIILIVLDSWVDKGNFYIQNRTSFSLKEKQKLYVCRKTDGLKMYNIKQGHTISERKRHVFLFDWKCHPQPLAQ